MSLEQFNTILLGAIAGLGVVWARWLKSYTAKKAENTATKEDIGEITRQIEGVKADYANKLEHLRANLGRESEAMRIRYSNEYDLLAELAGANADLHEKAMTLRPLLTTRQPETLAGAAQQAAVEFMQALQSFHGVVRRKRPLLHPTVLEATSAIEEVTTDEAAWFTAGWRRAEAGGPPPEPAEIPRALEVWRANRTALESAARGVEEVIRARVVRWEFGDADR